MKIEIFRQTKNFLYPIEHCYIWKPFHCVNDIYSVEEACILNGIPNLIDSWWLMELNEMHEYKFYRSFVFDVVL